MREILFRGKRTENGEWVEGYLVGAGDCMLIPRDSIHCGGEGFKEGYAYVVDPQTVGQCTGLCDRNDEWIFEGDVVRGVDRLNKGLEVCGHVGYENGSFVIVDDIMTHYRWLDYDVEIIGNIYDNPEPLGENENATALDTMTEMFHKELLWFNEKMLEED